MHCPECGAQLINNPKYCSNCGHAIKGNDVRAGQVTIDQSQEEFVAHTDLATPSLGSKWLKFWNYFSLPVGGVLGLLMSLGFISFSPILGIITASISILQFIVAYGLHHRKLWAWQWNWALIIITYIGMAIPTPSPGINGSEADLVVQFVIKAVLGGLIWMWPNYVYWKKRKDLFS